MNMMFPANRGRVAVRGLLMRNPVGCPCIYYCFPYSRHECTKPQNRKLLRFDVPNTPKNCCLTHNRLLIFFSSILSRYYNPVHPSPLAFIILSLDFFFFEIALSVWWWFCVVPE